MGNPGIPHEMSNCKCLPSGHSGLKMVTIKDNSGSSMYGLQIQGSIHSFTESIFFGLHDSPQTEDSWGNQTLVLCPCMTHYRYSAPSEVSRYLFSLIKDIAIFCPLSFAGIRYPDQEETTVLEYYQGQYGDQDNTRQEA